MTGNLYSLEYINIPKGVAGSNETGVYPFLLKDEGRFNPENVVNSLWF